DLCDPDAFILSLSYSVAFQRAATTALYPLSLHDALPIWTAGMQLVGGNADLGAQAILEAVGETGGGVDHHRAGIHLGDGQRLHRSEEHTSELQSRENLVCRLLLEKKKKRPKYMQSGRKVH